MRKVIYRVQKICYYFCVIQIKFWDLQFVTYYSNDVLCFAEL